MQKFKKIGDAFRHFDRDFDNQISFKEFRIVCEEMDLRYSSDEIKDLFGYLDSDGGGTIGYLEFTKLLDEKRQGLDPFTNQQINTESDDNDEMDVFHKRKDLFDIEKFKGPRKHYNNLND